MNGIVKAEHASQLPDFTDELKTKKFLLPLITETSSDFNIWERATEWLTDS